MLTKLRNVRAVLRKPADQKSLSEKLLIGGSITSVEIVFGFVIKIGSTLILTRLLSPEVYGLFAVIMTFHMVIGMVTNFGIRELILVSKGQEPAEFLQTCWTVQLIRGGIVFAVIVILSLGLYGLQLLDFVAPNTVYGSAELPAALACSGLILLLASAESVNVYVYTRMMRFGLISIKNLIYQSMYMIFSVIIALFFPSVWALVIAGILASILNNSLSFILFKGEKMKICLDKASMKSIVGDGKWIMAQHFMAAITSQADKIILSMFIPAGLFGLYHLARQFFEIPLLITHKIHGQFGIQFFNEILEKSRAEMQNKYYKYRIPFDAMICLCAGGFLTAAPAVFGLLYDPRYYDAGLILQVLGMGLPIVCFGLIRPAFLSQRQFKRSASFGVIQAISLIGGLFITLVVFENPYFAFIAVALHRIPELLIMLAFAWRNGWVNLSKEVRIFPMIGVGALIGWGVSLVIQTILE